MAVTEGPPASAGTTAKETNATTAATAKTGESPREISGASEAVSFPSYTHRIDGDIAKQTLFGTDGSGTKRE